MIYSRGDEGIRKTRYPLEDYSTSCSIDSSNSSSSGLKNTDTKSRYTEIEGLSSVSEFLIQSQNGVLKIMNAMPGYETYV